MGKRGPAKTPTELKVLRGTATVAQLEQQPAAPKAAGPPDPPEYLDLDWGRSTVIGDRSLHRDPEVVCALAAALIDAGRREEVAVDRGRGRHLARRLCSRLHPAPRRARASR